VSVARPNALILDHTALLALGKGSRQMSQIVRAAHIRPDFRAYVPALCLVAAATQRPGLNDHIGMLPALEVVALDFTATGSVSDLIRVGVDWGAAHAVHLGRPTIDWLEGRPVVTSLPDIYKAWSVRPIDVGP
jgi:hypothetical protein